MSDELSALIHRLSDSLFRLIYRIVRDRELALDLTQDVLVRVLPRFRPDEPDRLTGYAMRSAYHAALNAVRDRKRHTQVLDRIALESERPISSSDTMETSELQTQIERALTSLPEKQREAVVYRFYGDLTVPQIAAAMNISDGAVKVHLSRGLQRLNVQLTEVLEDRKI